MRKIRPIELKYAIFAMAKERELVSDDVKQEQFWENVTKYVKLPEYCRLVTAVLRKKGVDLDLMRAKLMMVCNRPSSYMRRHNGKRM